MVNDSIRSRLTDSIETATRLSKGIVICNIPDQGDELFSLDYACPEHGVSIEEMSPRMFSFNNPYGACKRCSGLGTFMEIDEDLVIPNKKLSINQGAIKASGWNVADGSSIAKMYFEALAKEYKAQVKQLIEMNRITIANGDIGFNFTDGNLIKKIFVDKLTQAQLINGRLAIARLLVDNNSEGEYAIIPASVADKIAQRDASSIVLHSALSAEEQDEDDPYADFKVPDDLMW